MNRPSDLTPQHHGSRNLACLGRERVPLEGGCNASPVLGGGVTLPVAPGNLRPYGRCNASPVLGGGVTGHYDDTGRHYQVATPVRCWGAVSHPQLYIVKCYPT